MSRPRPQEAVRAATWMAGQGLAPLVKASVAPSPASRPGFCDRSSSVRGALSCPWPCLRRPAAFVTVVGDGRDDPAVWSHRRYGLASLQPEPPSRKVAQRCRWWPDYAASPGHIPGSDGEKRLHLRHRNGAIAPPRRRYCSPGDRAGGGFAIFETVAPGGDGPRSRRNRSSDVAPVAVGHRHRQRMQLPRCR